MIRYGFRWCVFGTQWSFDGLGAYSGTVRLEKFGTFGFNAGLLFQVHAWKSAVLLVLGGLCGCIGTELCGILDSEGMFVRRIRLSRDENHFYSIVLMIVGFCFREIIFMFSSIVNVEDRALENKRD